MSRKAGILLPIFSLPSEYGIGTLGRAAYRWVDFLNDAHQKLWQVLPVGPTSYGDSPYQSLSAFAGNPYFIDLELLCDQKLLAKDECTAIQWEYTSGKIEYKILYDNRYTYVKNCVVYTGTHDNDTLHGWTMSAAPEDVRYAKEYIDYSTDRGSLERQLIRVAMASVGDTVIIPIQDWLELGSEAKINQPSTLGCNWLWRMNSGACTSALANEIAQMTELYGR